MVQQITMRIWSFDEDADFRLLSWFGSTLGGAPGTEVPHSFHVRVPSSTHQKGIEVTGIEVRVSNSSTPQSLKEDMVNQIRYYLDAQDPALSLQRLVVFAKAYRRSSVSGVDELQEWDSIGSVTLQASAIRQPVGVAPQIVPTKPQEPAMAGRDHDFEPDEENNDEPEFEEEEEEEEEGEDEPEFEEEDEPEFEEEEEEEELPQKSAHRHKQPSQRALPARRPLQAPSLPPGYQRKTPQVAPMAVPRETVKLDDILRGSHGTDDPDRLFATMIGAGVNAGQGVPAEFALMLMLMNRETMRDQRRTMEQLLVAVMGDRQARRDEHLADAGVNRELMQSAIEAATNAARLNYEANLRQGVESERDRLAREVSKAQARLSELEQEKARLTGKIQAGKAGDPTDRALDMIAAVLQGAKQQGAATQGPPQQAAPQQQEPHHVRRVPDPVLNPAPADGGGAFASLGAGLDAGLQVARAAADGSFPDLASLAPMLSFATTEQIGDLLSKFTNGNPDVLRRIAAAAEAKLTE